MPVKRWGYLNGREREKGFHQAHQGLVFILLLFIILEALSMEFKEGLPMELLFTEYYRWSRLDGRNRGIVTGKIKERDGSKGSYFLEWILVRQKSRGVWWIGLGVRILENIHVVSAGNSIRCLWWVHKGCSGISGKLENNVDFCWKIIIIIIK